MSPMASNCLSVTPPSSVKTVQQKAQYKDDQCKKKLQLFISLCSPAASVEDCPN